MCTDQILVRFKLPLANLLDANSTAAKQGQDALVLEMDMWAVAF